MKVWVGRGLSLAMLFVPVMLRAEPQVLVMESPLFGATHILLEVPTHPLGLVVLLPGGDGKVGISEHGNVANTSNFVVRTRKTWLANDFGYMLVDAPQGGPSLLGRRHTSEYAAVLAAAVRRLVVYRVPVVLLGISQGSIAAASAASLLGGSVSGVVLTSTVAAKGSSGEIIFDAALSGITAPVLIVDNAGDHCPSSPPAMSDALAAALTSAASVEKIHFSSHLATGDQCGPFSPHGYLGIEDVVLEQVRAWVDRRVPGL